MAGVGGGVESLGVGGGVAGWLTRLSVASGGGALTSWQKEGKQARRRDRKSGPASPWAFACRSSLPSARFYQIWVARGR